MFRTHHVGLGCPQQVHPQHRDDDPLNGVAMNGLGQQHPFPLRPSPEFTGAGLGRRILTREPIRRERIEALVLITQPRVEAVRGGYVSSRWPGR